MLIKTVNVTNPRNVVVQIPGCVIASWGTQLGSRLEVHYNEQQNSVTIKPAVQRRRGPIEGCDELASTSEAR